MKRVVWAAVLCSGCAHGLSDAVRYADKGLGIVDVTIDESTDLFNAATDAAIKNCVAVKDTTAAERNACLAKQGFSPEQIEKVEKALEALGQAYDLAAESLKIIREVLPVIEQANESAKEVLQ